MTFVCVRFFKFSDAKQSIVAVLRRRRIQENGTTEARFHQRAAAPSATINGNRHTGEGAEGRELGVASAGRDVTIHRIVLAANTMDDRLQFVRRIFDPPANVTTRKLSRFTPQSARLAKDPTDVMAGNDDVDGRFFNHASHHRTT